MPQPSRVLFDTNVWLARKHQRIHEDFEDCLVLAAAQRLRRTSS